MPARLIFGTIAITASAIALFLASVQVEKGELSEYAFWLCFVLLIGVVGAESYGFLHAATWAPYGWNGY